MIKKWKNKIIYQIFPASFKDTTGNGFGDINGIIEKLDYISKLGVDVIWLCPIYDTEFKDAGYDVLNYFEVWKKFGTLQDFELFAKKAKKLNLEIVMDIVLNHTSNKHKWFKKAIEDPNSDEHDYYIWKEKPPKSKSIFGGSAWEYIPSLNKYYYHLFTKEQVDLNWANPNTIKAMANIIDFWYNKGVKGFRLDAIQHIEKEFKKGKVIYSFAKNMDKYLQEFVNKIRKDKNDIFLIGEATAISPKQIIKYGDSNLGLIDNFFNFSWWYIGWDKKTGRNGMDKNFQISQFVNKNAQEIQKNSKIKSYSISNFLTSHDTSRAVSRWGSEKFWVESSKALALFQFTQKGIPIIYYGEEIGMNNPGFKSRKEFRDVDALNSYKKYVDEEKYYSEKEMTEAHAFNGRDNARSPMQWNAKINSGFSNAKKTWIKTGENYLKINVQKQIGNKGSLLNWYKKLINFRKKSAFSDLFINGKSQLKLLINNVIKIERKNSCNKIISLINLSSKIIECEKILGKVLFSSYDEMEPRSELRPFEAQMILVE